MSRIEKRENNYYLINGDTEKVVPTKVDAKTGVVWLKLPENEEGRQWMSSNKFKDTNVVELTPHVDRVCTARNGEPKEKKPLEDYLNDEDKALYLALVEKAKKNRAEANKRVPMTEKEKLQAKVARLQAQIAKMESEEA